MDKEKKENSRKEHRTSIGGQAVMEGVMMRGPHNVATAVRKPDGEIVIDDMKLGKIRTGRFVKLPIVRGCVNFIDSMIIGVKSLMFSAQFIDVDDDGEPIEQEPSKFEMWLDEKLGSEKAMNIVIYISVIFSLALSIGMFILLPAFITGFLKSVIQSRVGLTLIEGIVRIAIFVLYLFLVSQMKDIKRVFMYHGAEHKSIFCYEKGLDLTVENVRVQSRLHPRCGTSFLFVVVAISILLFALVSAVFPTSNMLVRMLIRLALLPFVVSISYECNRFVGRHDNALTRALSAPGMWFQHFTTNEPDDSMLEVAIEALKLVIPDEAGADRW